tara:strand:+ start:314 stop:472 length:159 start_codon:yes stop_codon:yes gene_type:complete
MYRTSLILKKLKNSSKIVQIKKLKKKELTQYDLSIISLNNIINAINKSKKLK